MSDRYEFSGSFTASPLVGSPSFSQAVTAPIEESLVIKNWKRVRVELTADAIAAVSFDQMASAAVVILKVIEGGPKAKASLTSADGSLQVIPFEYLVLGSQTVPFTGVSLTRVSGTATTVEVFLGEKA